jgi:hypothetical protein
LEENYECKMKKAIVAYFKELHLAPEGVTEEEHEKVLFRSILCSISWAYIFIGMYICSVM